MRRWRSARHVATAALTAGVTIAASVVAASAPAAAAPPPDAWTSIGGDAANSSTNLGEHTVTTRTAARLRTAWTRKDFLGPVAPVVVKGIAYTVRQVGGADGKSEVWAMDVRNGRRLWRLTLPGPARTYLGGTAVAGDVLVVPYEGWHEAGGLTAVDLRTRRVLWSHSHPRSSHEGTATPDTSGGVVVLDSGRAYLTTDSVLQAAYQIRTGRLLWQRSPRSGYYGGIAAASGRLYATYTSADHDDSLVVSDGRTGRALWSAPNLQGPPVLAGAMVVAHVGQGVGAVAAAGCGRRTCPLRWLRTPLFDSPYASVGAASASSVFVSGERTQDAWPGSGGLLLRLDPRTGRTQWSVRRTLRFASVPVRGGDMVWINEWGTHVLGWPVTATSTEPLVTLPLEDENFSGDLAVAGGSLLVQKWADALTVFRVPGT